MYDLQTLIFYAKEKNTSDVHLTVGLPPMLRIDGELRTHGDVPLTEQDVQDADPVQHPVCRGHPACRRTAESSASTATARR